MLTLAPQSANVLSNFTVLVLSEGQILLTIVLISILANMVHFPSVVKAVELW